MHIKGNNFESFIANTDVLQAVLSEIRSNANSAIPQPVMIIGPEGSGKSTLLRRLENESRGTDTIWIDGRYAVSSDFIISQCREANANIVFIDDMDYYFSRCDYDEQYRLRRFLNTEGAPMLVCSVSRVLPAIADYGAPFFEGMKVMHLDEISKDTFLTMYSGDAAARAEAMFRLLPPYIKSLKLISLALQVNNNAAEDIPFLLSAYSVIFREKYDSLPQYSQQILNALSSDKSGMTITEMRAKSGLPTNVLTAYLKSLSKQDLVEADKSVKRHTRYVLKAPLMGIWLNGTTQTSAS